MVVQSVCLHLSEPPPTFTATGVTTFIRKEEFSVSFGCKFTLSSENLLYQVYWSIDGNYQQNFTKQYFNSSRLPELDLTEEDLERFGIGLGINVVCFVRCIMIKNCVYYFYVSKHHGNSRLPGNSALACV